MGLRLARVPAAGPKVEKPPEPKPAAATDPFQANTLWVVVGTASSLRITERTGDEFRGVFGNGRTIERKILGTVSDGKIAWLAKDVIAVKGGPGGNNSGTITQDKDGFRIDGTWQDGQASGEFVLRRQPGK